MNTADQTLPRRRLTIADLKPSSRIPEPSQVRSVSKPTIADNTPKTIQPAQKHSTPPVPTTPVSCIAANTHKATQPAQACVAPPVPTIPVPCAVERDADNFPVGWCFDHYSWGLHRSLWFEHGIHLDVGEYVALMRQCRAGTGERLQCNIWQLRLRSGRTIIVAVRKTTPLAVLPDTGWEQHGAWADALVQHMPAPPLTPRRVGGRTAAQKAKDKRKRQNRQARRRAERLAQVTAGA